MSDKDNGSRKTKSISLHVVRQLRTEIPRDTFHIAYDVLTTAPVGCKVQDRFLVDHSEFLDSLLVGKIHDSGETSNRALRGNTRWFHKDVSVTTCSTRQHGKDADGWRLSCVLDRRDGGLSSRRSRAVSVICRRTPWSSMLPPVRPSDQVSQWIVVRR